MATDNTTAQKLYQSLSNSKSSYAPTAYSFHTYGASMGVGTPSSTTGTYVGNRTSSRIGVLLGVASANEVNRAVGGSTLSADNDTTRQAGKPWGSTGGWVTSFNNDGPGTRTFYPLGSNKQVVLLFQTADLPSMGPAKMDLYNYVLEAVIRRHRAGSIWEDTHASIAYTGSWSTAAATKVNSGAGYHYTTTNGDSATITVPNFVPNNSTLTFQTITTYGLSSLMTFTKNGVAAGTLDASAISSFDNVASTGRVSPITKSFTVNPGDTLTITYSNIVAFGIFDSYFVEADVPPIIAQFKIHQFLDYAVYKSSSWTFAAEWPDFQTQYNARIDQVVNLFDEKVVAIGYDTIINPNNSYLYDDYAHPNSRGAAMVAAYTVQQLAPLLNTFQLSNTAVA